MSEYVWAVMSDAKLYWRWGQKFTPHSGEAKRLTEAEAHRVAKILEMQNAGHKFGVVHVGAKND